MKISILIPARNEEATIARCIRSCLTQSRKPDEIVVVNDGSVDRTENILNKFKRKIKKVKITTSTGSKSKAQEIGLKKITGDIFLTLDADSTLHKDAVKRIEELFLDKNIYAVCGYVYSTKHNWLTALRQLEYLVGQDIHKNAQDKINALYVMPGCITAFRSKYFKRNITFDHDTLTEDLDFTFKMHYLGKKIKFDKNIIVYTQDPADIKSYVKQISRWYGGGWQNILKHYKKVKSPSLIIEYTFAYVESLLGFLLFNLVFISFHEVEWLFVYYLIYSLTIAIYGFIKTKRWDLIFYSPLYILIVYLNFLVFFVEFVRVVILRKKRFVWYTPVRRAFS